MDVGERAPVDVRLGEGVADRDRAVVVDPDDVPGPGVLGELADGPLPLADGGAIEERMEELELGRRRRRGRRPGSRTDGLSGCGADERI